MPFRKKPRATTCTTPIVTPADPADACCDNCHGCEPATHDVHWESDDVWEKYCDSCYASEIHPVFQKLEGNLHPDAKSDPTTEPVTGQEAP